MIGRRSRVQVATAAVDMTHQHAFKQGIPAKLVGVRDTPPLYNAYPAMKKVPPPPMPPLLPHTSL